MLDIANQYRIISRGAAHPADPIGAAHAAGDAAAGWRRRIERGRLRFDGRDRMTFLQALVTNDVASLQAGQGVYAAFLTPQGRMITDLRLYVRGDHVMIDVPLPLADPLVTRFDQLIFSEDVQVADVSATIAQLSVCGVAAADVLTTALGASALEAAALRALAVGAHLEIGGGFVARTDESALPSYDVFLPAERADSLTRALTDARAIPLSDELATALRIEAGRPAFGVDMTEDTIPLEAGLLERAISTTKGCYPGQEVVIRVLHRGGGRVARRLVRLVIDPAMTSAPPAGTPLFVDARETGRITSAAWSPVSDRVVALGYVHRDVAEPGRTVDVAVPAGATATISGFAS